MAGSRSPRDVYKRQATASLVTAFFIPDRFHTNGPQMIHGIHKAFFALGLFTMPVSYTHLDVYKRQRTYPASRM